jgi:hypothetical protein
MDRYGDLGDSWESAPRFLFVWENLLAHLPPSKIGAERRWIKLKRWQKAFALWEWDIQMRNAVIDASWRRHIVSDVLITHPKPFAELVVAQLEDHAWPITRVINRSLEDLEHSLPHMPEITVVFHGEANRPFLFGARGHLAQTTGDILG